MPIDPARIARFVAAYTAKPHIREAALQAGYAPRSAGDLGYHMLQRPEVQAALAAHAEGEFQTIERQAGRVLAEAARIAFADPAGLFDAKGRLKPVPEMSGDCLAAVSRVEETRQGGVRLLRHGKLAALALLARYLHFMTPGADVFASQEEAREEAANEPPPLLPRQARFAAEFTVDFNATKAAIRAGYAAKWAQNRGYKLLLEPAVQAAIAARAHSRFARSALSAERVLREIARIAFFDMRCLVRDGCLPRTIHDLDDDARAVFAMIEIAPRHRRAALKFRSLNKLAALRLLMDVLEANGPPDEESCPPNRESCPPDEESCPPHSDGEVPVIRAEGS